MNLLGFDTFINQVLRKSAIDPFRTLGIMNGIFHAMENTHGRALKISGTLWTEDPGCYLEGLITTQQPKNLA